MYHIQKSIFQMLIIFIRFENFLLVTLYCLNSLAFFFVFFLDGTSIICDEPLATNEVYSPCLIALFAVMKFPIR